MFRPLLAACLALLAVPVALAGEPSAIEDSNFAPESGWNHGDAVVQYTTFYLADAASHEVTQEWGAPSQRHQFSYAIPFYSDRASGLGDAMVSYRYQAVGGEGSRIGIAPRASIILPTRSARFGVASTGVQLNVPISAALTPRLVSHTNVGTSWFRDRDQRELNLSQQLALTLSDRVSITVDAAYTRDHHGSHLTVVRPGIQFSFEAPGGLVVSPGVAFPRGGGSEGILLSISLARRLDAAQ